MLYQPQQHGCCGSQRGWSPLSPVRAGALWGREAMDGFPYACIPHLLVGKAYGLATEDVCHLKGTFPYDIPVVFSRVKE